ncbi:cell wall-binding repeat-containing protein [Streptomyces sp. NBC_00704]|uniref:cell wall-binding repeat-containing protein n=1 Tax=Streptomyces sp. NBC_00704 TaxID=2975809 RepID=UPI002E31B16C|nr:cell wall-binding repeat-containing protein [Streptomyces sp. NBC_00704]
MRRRAAVLATAAVLAAMGSLATAPGAAADDAGPWPGTEGAVLTDGGTLTNPTTGTVLHVPNVGAHATWAPDGSRIVSAWRSVRPDGSDKLALPPAQGMRSTPSYQDLTFWWGGRYLVFSSNGQLAYGLSDGSGAPGPLLPESLEPAGVCDTDPTVNPQGQVAFERGAQGCRDYGGVFVYDSAARTVQRVLTDAGQPAYSPDGTRLAFVRKVDGAPQIFTANADGTDVRQRTSGPRRFANPSWSPTGARIVFDAHTSAQADDVHTTEYVDLSTGELTRVGDRAAGSNPSWQPLRKNGVGRVWGADAYSTNIASSRWTWNTVGQNVPGLMNAKSAVLVNRDDPSYALTAPALAGKKRGPVLMTPKTGLSAPVRRELKRAVRPGSTVYLVGGTAVLNGPVATQLKTLGYAVKRVSGADRYATSVAVAKAIAPSPKYVFLAGGSEYRAALAAASAAGADGADAAGGVVLTNGKTLTASVKAYLNSLNPDRTMVITVGAAAKYALLHGSYPRWPSTYSYYPITGGTDAAISVAIAKFWWAAPGQTALAHTGAWRDGVSAAAAMNVFGPLLWTARPALSSEIGGYLRRESAGVDFTVAFGPTGGVTGTELNTVGAAISAGGRYFEYRPYYDGVIPARAGQSAFALGGDGDRPAAGPAVAAPRPAPAGARPDLASLRTLHRQ